MDEVSARVTTLVYRKLTLPVFASINQYFCTITGAKRCSLLYVYEM